MYSVTPRKIIKALKALVGRLSLHVGWENGSERGFKTASFNPYLPVIQANSAKPNQMLHSGASDLGLHCLPLSKTKFYIYPSLHGTLTSQ